MFERRTFATVLLTLAALHCVSYEPGIEVTVDVAGTPPTLGFVSAHGIEARLNEATLHVERIDLRRCDEGYSMGSVARAHGASSGNGPWRLELATGGRVGETLRPSPGRYCALVLHLDGRSFEGAPSVRVAGRYGRAPVELTHAEPVDWVLPLETPLALTRAEDRPALQVTVDQRKLFDEPTAPLMTRLANATRVESR